MRFMFMFISGVLFDQHSCALSNSLLASSTRFAILTKAVFRDYRTTLVGLQCDFKQSQACKRAAFVQTPTLGRLCDFACTGLQSPRVSNKKLHCFVCSYPIFRSHSSTQRNACAASNSPTTRTCKLERGCAASKQPQVCRPLGGRTS